METKISENFLTKVLDKWGDKWWFKTLFTIAVVWILVGPLATTFINNSDYVVNQDYIEKGITEFNPIGAGSNEK